MNGVTQSKFIMKVKPLPGVIGDVTLNSRNLCVENTFETAFFVFAVHSGNNVLCICEKIAD